MKKICILIISLVSLCLIILMPQIISIVINFDFDNEKIFLFYGNYIGGVVGAAVAFFIVKYQIRLERKREAQAEKDFEIWILNTYLESIIREIEFVINDIEHKGKIGISMIGYDLCYIDDQYMYINKLGSWANQNKLKLAEIFKNINKLPHIQDSVIKIDWERNNIIIKSKLSGIKESDIKDLINELDSIKAKKIELLLKTSKKVINSCRELQKDYAKK